MPGLRLARRRRSRRQVECTKHPQPLRDTHNKVTISLGQRPPLVISSSTTAARCWDEGRGRGFPRRLLCPFLLLAFLLPGKRDLPFLRPSNPCTLVDDGQWELASIWAAVRLGATTCSDCGGILTLTQEHPYCAYVVLPGGAVKEDDG